MNGKKAKQLHKVATSLHKTGGGVYKDYELVKFERRKIAPNLTYVVGTSVTRQLVPCVRKTYRFLKRDYVRKQINLGVKI